jgi:hypothetical protein
MTFHPLDWRSSPRGFPLGDGCHDIFPLNEPIGAIFAIIEGEPTR